MVHPPSQTVTAKEGEPLTIVVEFCAEPRYTKVLWMSEENVYVPGAPARDGVQALAIEVPFFFFYPIMKNVCSPFSHDSSSVSNNDPYFYAPSSCSDSIGIPLYRP